MIKGKFNYLAPEYLAGKLDARCDIWALGVVMYEMLTSRRLFDAPDIFDLMTRIKKFPIPRPSLANPRVTPDLDQIVMTALERNPTHRWQTAAMMRDARAGRDLAAGQLRRSPPRCRLDALALHAEAGDRGEWCLGARQDDDAEAPAADSGARHDRGDGAAQVAAEDPPARARKAITARTTSRVASVSTARSNACGAPGTLSTCERQVACERGSDEAVERGVEPGHLVGAGAHHEQRDRRQVADRWSREAEARGGIGDVERVRVQQRGARNSAARDLRERRRAVAGARDQRDALGIDGGMARELAHGFVELAGVQHADEPGGGDESRPRRERRHLFELACRVRPAAREHDGGASPVVAGRFVEVEAFAALDGDVIHPGQREYDAALHQVWHGAHRSAMESAVAAAARGPERRSATLLCAPGYSDC